MLIWFLHSYAFLFEISPWKRWRWWVQRWLEAYEQGIRHSVEVWLILAFNGHTFISMQKDEDIAADWGLILSQAVDAAERFIPALEMLVVDRKPMFFAFSLQITSAAFLTCAGMQTEMIISRNRMLTVVARLLARPSFSIVVFQCIISAISTYIIQCVWRRIPATFRPPPPRLIEHITAVQNFAKRVFSLAVINCKLLSSHYKLLSSGSLSVMSLQY